MNINMPHETGDTAMSKSITNNVQEKLQENQCTDSISFEVSMFPKRLMCRRNSFIFEFSPNYPEDIEKIIYPSHLDVKKIDKVIMPTIQFVGKFTARCLICHYNITVSGLNRKLTRYLNHASGDQHLRNANNAQKIKWLQFYHEFWWKQEDKFQAHQIYFKRRSEDTFECTLCSELLRSSEIITHILSNKHKMKILYPCDESCHDKNLTYLMKRCYNLNPDDVKSENSSNNKKHKERRMRKKNTELKKHIQKLKGPNKIANSEEQLHQSNPNPTDNLFKSVKFTNSTDPFDHLPNRMQCERKYFQKKLRSLEHCNQNKNQVQMAPIVQIFCDLCSCVLPNNDVNSIKIHLIKSSKHQFKDLEKFTFFCDFCNLKFKSELDWLQHDFNGPKHNNKGTTRKSLATEYECHYCKMVIFGDPVTLIRHRCSAINQTKKSKKIGNNLPNAILMLLKSKDIIKTTGDLLVKESEDVLNDSISRNCYEKIHEIILPLFPNCKIYPFGSRVSGIGSKTSDLDIFIDTDATSYNGEHCREIYDQVMLVRKVSKLFTKNKNYCGVVPVPTARTPILRFHCMTTDLDCDLSFKNGLSVENTKFIKFCLELQPITRPFILIIKKWTESALSVKSPGTYVLALMCIFYLQTQGYLLSVEKLRQLNDRKRQIEENNSICGGWNIITYVLPLQEVKKHIRQYPNDLHDLIKEFFTYFAKFDFHKFVVCPLLGHQIKKNIFSTNICEIGEHERKNETVIKSLELYFKQLNLKSEQSEIFRYESVMCIQDPFDLSHNLTKAVSSAVVNKFKCMCEFTVKHLDELN